MKSAAVYAEDLSFMVIGDTGMRRLLVFSMFAIAATFAKASSTDVVPEKYERALELIHSFNGSGDELNRAMRLIKELESSHPKSGLAQTLVAEALSTWELDQDGEPKALRKEIIELTESALQLNPRLAQAYVARARVHLRASNFGEATKANDAAIAIAPNLPGALFIRAEIFRRTGRVADAAEWYRKFIESTPSQTRRSNGYYWLGKTYEDAAMRRALDRQELLSKARAAYEQAVALSPNGAWPNVNFAIFLNDMVGDFDAAERYAKKALGIMEFPMARYHLAIARYQSLSKQVERMDDKALSAAVDQIRSSTRVSFTDAIKFAEGWPEIHSRLKKIQVRIK